MATGTVTLRVPRPERRPRGVTAKGAWGVFVILRRKSGWVRNVLTNPSDPEAVLADLRREAPHLAGA